MVRVGPDPDDAVGIGRAGGAARGLGGVCDPTRAALGTLRTADVDAGAGVAAGVGIGGAGGSSSINSKEHTTGQDLATGIRQRQVGCLCVDCHRPKRGLNA